MHRSQQTRSQSRWSSAHDELRTLEPRSFEETIAKGGDAFWLVLFRGKAVQARP